MRQVAALSPVMCDTMPGVSLIEVEYKAVMHITQEVLWLHLY